MGVCRSWLESNTATNAQQIEAFAKRRGHAVVEVETGEKGR